MNEILRYFVDIRGGCVAVRDRINTDSDYNGLHNDTDGVVKFWDGTLTKIKCPHCNQTMRTEWTVSDEDIKQAEDLCHKLNIEEPIRYRRHPGDFDGWPSDEQMEYFKRGGR